MTKVYGECVMCDNMATSIILDECAIDYLDVCNDCYKEVFINVANSGEDVFYEWAVEMYGEEKAYRFTNEVFGRKFKEDEEYVSLFTYGILKYPQNIQREGGINIVENATVKGHKIYLYNNSFPITKMTGNNNDVVYGTVFDVPMSMITEHYDIVEGCNPKAHPSTNMYNRIEVDVILPDGSTKKAQMYYANDNRRMFGGEYNSNNLIPTGNFDDRHLAKSYNQKRDHRK